MSLTITQQDRQLLEFIATGESGGDYTVVNRIGRVPQLTSMTIQQVLDYTNRVRQGPSSGAAGKYQFIPGTLSEVVRRANIPLNTVFSPDVQDYLIIQRLKQFRRYDSWLSGSTTDDQFALQLAMEFASMPVPRFVAQNEIARGAPAGNRQYGQSFYEGDSAGNRVVGHTVEQVLQRLADIRTGGPGATITLSQEFSASPAGTLPMTQAEIAAGGGQRLRGGSPYAPSAYNNQLPAASDPYLYVPIAAESNRYDFRTGKKVNNLLVNGINPASNAGAIAGGGSPAPVLIGYGVNQVDPALARAAGIVPGPNTPQARTTATPPRPTQGPQPLPSAPNASGGISV